MSATLTLQAATSNKVLRNTFALLALSLLPTALGAWLGMAMGIPALMAGSPLIYSLGFLAISFGLLFAISATRTSALSIALVGVFTLVMGMALSGILSVALGMANGIDIVTMAALGTAAVVAGCSVYATRTTRDFTSIGGFLFGSVIALIVVSLLNIFLQLSFLSILLSIAAIVIFSAFMVFDVQRIVKGGETNYVMATVSIYLNIYNIFSSMLHLLTAFSLSDE